YYTRIVICGTSARRSSQIPLVCQPPACSEVTTAAIARPELCCTTGTQQYGSSLTGCAFTAYCRLPMCHTHNWVASGSISPCAVPDQTRLINPSCCEFPPACRQESAADSVCRPGAYRSSV